MTLYIKRSKELRPVIQSSKKILKKNKIYELLDRKLSRFKKKQFQNVLKFNAEDAVYQTNLDRLKKIISTSLRVRAATHVVNTEELIKIISKFQSAY